MTVPATPQPVPQDWVAAVLVAALIVAVPLAVGHPVWWAAGGSGDWTRSVVLAPFDLILAILVAWSSTQRPSWRVLFRSRLSRAGAATFTVGFAIALAAHPSWLGVALGLRLGAGLLVVAVAGTALGGHVSRRLVLVVVTAVGVSQALLATVQSARGEAFGVAPIDWEGLLYPFGSSFAGRGSLTHPYHLAVLLVVAQGAALLGLRSTSRRAPWLAALAVIGLGIGVTYTRAGLIGQLAFLGVALISRRAGPTRWAAAAVAIGLLLGGSAFGTGWIAKADATGGVDPTSSRTDRLDEAGELISDEPLVGVGPGRYVTALAAEDRPELLPAHNLLAHEAAELGVLGAVGTVLLLAALARRAVRGGAWALMVAFPMVPFLAFDAFPYVFPAGLVLTAIWLALVRAAGPGA